jgi:glycosyltransferase involved in cell wall biosynthesis
MATFNGEKYLKRQINSIIQQLSSTDELIISDDSSNDDTLKIIDDFDDFRIKKSIENKFYSPIYNFENALSQSTGDHIFLADQDDIWESNKVEVMIDYLQRCDLVVSDASVIDGDIVIYDSFFKMNNSKGGFFHNFVKNSYLGCCMAFNRKILEFALPFPKCIPMHDIWIGMIAEVFGTVCFCNEKLVKYRKHSKNTSPALGKSNYSFSQKLSFRKNLIINLLKRVFERRYSGLKLRVPYFR